MTELTLTEKVKIVIEVKNEEGAHVAELQGTMVARFKGPNGEEAELNAEPAGKHGMFIVRFQVILFVLFCFVLFISFKVRS